MMKQYNKTVMAKLAAILLPATVFFSTGAQAETVFDNETVSVIQERIYERNHDINVSMGYIPDDDYFESYPISVAYTYHFNKNIAWEVGRGQYFFHQEKELKGQLENRFSVTPEEFDKITYMAHSSFVIKPSYGKDALFDRGIINHEGYFLLGGGIANYEREFSFGEPTSETVFSVTYGAGRRYFLSKKFALTLELKGYTNFKDTKTETNVYMGAGLSYRFNFSNRINAVREKTDSVYRYLNDEEE